MSVLVACTFAGCLAESPEPQESVQAIAPYDDETEISTTSSALTAEFEFGVLNVADGRQTTQSSTGAGAASLAVDGVRNGVLAAGSVSSTAASDTSPWWEVDLGKNQFVLTVEVYNRTDCCSDSLNGASIELRDANRAVLMRKTLSGAWSQTVSFLPGRSARYVRISKKSAGLALAEVIVNAPAAQINTEDNFCWLPTYGRGAGTVPTSCAGKQKDAGLCYNWCRSGYYGVGPVCWQKCPSGYTDDGALCRRDAKIISADNSECPWYDKCGLTLAPGCSTCPAGYRNDGCTCRIDAHVFAKASYGRGAGTPMVCTSDLEMDAGLCYTPCRAEYNGVGPVCWGECPPNRPVACGAGCAQDEAACAESVATMVTAPIEAVENIALLVLSFGTSAAATVPLKATMTATQKTAMKTSLKTAMKSFYKKLGDFVEDEAEAFAEEAANQLMDANEQLMSGQAASFDLISLATSLDPTGLAAVGVAFAKPICE